MPTARPADQFEVAIGRGRNRLLGELATVAVDGHDRVGPLV
jgi:hypothetical protein